MAENSAGTLCENLGIFFIQATKPVQNTLRAIRATYLREIKEAANVGHLAGVVAHTVNLKVPPRGFQ